MDARSDGKKKASPASILPDGLAGPEVLLGEASLTARLPAGRIDIRNLEPRPGGTFPMKRIALLLLCAGVTVSSPRAAQAAGLPQEVQAVLRTRCVECHGGKAVKGRLNLTTPAGLARGGRSGATVRPGQPDASLLWKKLRDEEMPPEAPLPAAERQVLRQWIASGAPGLPADAGPHWAFVPPRRPAVPAATQPGLRNAVDRFIAAALDEKKLALAPEADRLTLLRRVAFDLTGLPPSAEEMAAFGAEDSPDAYERMVERYLASPHYGERWGKFWLDTAGYADSNGYFNADTDRPLAYKYRDYVIRSFNSDKPFDRFVREQIAGDEMAGYTPGADVTPAMADLLIATHFLRNAPDGSGESDGNPDEVRTDRMTVLEGNLQVAMNCLLGVTIQCARCHEHKFEPITHEEYYRLQAILYPVYCPDRWVKPNERTVAVATRHEREEHRQRSERVDRAVRALQEGLTIQAGPYREQVVEERLAGLDAAIRTAILAAVRAPNDKVTPEQQALLKKHVEPLKISDDDLARRFPEYAALREQVRKAVAVREKERPAPLEKLAVVAEVALPPPAHHLLLRGQHNKPGKEVQPGVPAAFCTPANTYAIAPQNPQKPAGTGRRAAFARWVTSSENPLFARVFVNRVWQHHFGKGLVGTPDNFGLSGARPSHPELLDFLAVEFIDSGRSVKHLHRLILSSATYRQTSASPAKTRLVDPDNRLLGRFPLRRLDAEALRDAMLAVSGELDRRPGGPYVPTHRTAEGNVEVDEKHAGARRRSVYLQQRRTQVATFLELFDAPSIAVTCSARNTSTVPLQALALLNADFTRLRAAAFARRLLREAPAGGRLALAFRLACGREPRDGERAAAERFLDRQRQLYRSAGGPSADDKAWTDLCQMLLASNAFLYVE
jgi:mono/diheme cytochrome c family protein